MAEQSTPSPRPGLDVTAANILNWVMVSALGLLVMIAGILPAISFFKTLPASQFSFQAFFHSTEQTIQLFDFLAIEIVGLQIIVFSYNTLRSALGNDANANTSKVIDRSMPTPRGESGFRAKTVLGSTLGLLLLTGGLSQMIALFKTLPADEQSFHVFIRSHKLLSQLTSEIFFVVIGAQFIALHYMKLRSALTGRSRLTDRLRSDGALGE